MRKFSSRGGHAHSDAEVVETPVICSRSTRLTGSAAASTRRPATVACTSAHAAGDDRSAARAEESGARVLGAEIRAPQRAATSGPSGAETALHGHARAFEIDTGTGGQFRRHPIVNLVGRGRAGSAGDAGVAGSSGVE